MNGSEWLSEQFEANRAHLRAVAYRILGSLAEADDAIQECWLRVSRADTATVENFEGWLTTVLARICLNILRSRKSRREEPLPEHVDRPEFAVVNRGDPQQEAILAESVGLALLVVLERLTPAERVAFVLHEVFGISFDEIAPIVKRTPTAARKLASRARQRVRGTGTTQATALAQKRDVIEQFLSALRAGDMPALLAILDPNIVRRADKAAVPHSIPRELRGAALVANEAMTYTRVAHIARQAVVGGSVGFIVAPRGRLRIAVRCTVRAGKITEMVVVADPSGLRKLKISDPFS